MEPQVRSTGTPIDGPLEVWGTSVQVDAVRLQHRWDIKLLTSWNPSVLLLNEGSDVQEELVITNLRRTSIVEESCTILLGPVLVLSRKSEAI